MLDSAGKRVAEQGHHRTSGSGLLAVCKSHSCYFSLLFIWPFSGNLSRSVPHHIPMIFRVQDFYRPDALPVTQLTVSGTRRAQKLQTDARFSVTSEVFRKSLLRWDA